MIFFILKHGIAKLERSDYRSRFFFPVSSPVDLKIRRKSDIFSSPKLSGNWCDSRFGDWLIGIQKFPISSPGNGKKGIFSSLKTDKESDWFPVWRLSEVPHFFPGKRVFPRFFPIKGKSETCGRSAIKCQT